MKMVTSDAAEDFFAVFNEVQEKSGNMRILDFSKSLPLLQNFLRRPPKQVSTFQTP